MFEVFFSNDSLLPHLRILEQARASLCNLNEKNCKQCSQALVQALQSTTKDLKNMLAGWEIPGTDTKLAELKLYTRMLMLDPSIPVRIIEGLLIVYNTEAHQVEKIAALCEDVPKALRPVVQPMGQAGFMKGFEDVFPYVLPAVDADADWNSVPDPDNLTLHNIKLEREQALTKDFGCEDAGAGEIPDEDVPGQGSVRRLRSDPEGRLLGVASHEGQIYMRNKDWKLFRGNVSGFTEINGQLGVPYWPGGFAVSGNKLVAIARDYLWVGEICESDAVKSVQNKFDLRLGTHGHGVSMNESYAYFCCGHSVQRLDLVTGRISPVMGDKDRAGCGSVEAAATDLLLISPSDTALVGNSLFVADSDNGRVLCYDMSRNECRIIFEGTQPLRLAADHGSLFVYDSAQAKIFHVDLDTWRVEHVLGTEERGSSEEGLPPLSTHLGEICSMAVGHDGELVYIEDNRLLRAFKLASKAASDPRALCATKVALFQEVSGEESDALVPLAELQPTYGAEWRVFCPKTVPMPMFASEILPLNQDRLSLKFNLASPTHGLGISIVPDVNTPGTSAQRDSHLFSHPDWAAKTFVSTLSVMQELQQEMQELEKKPWPKFFKKAWASFHNMVINSEAGQETLLGKPFHFRNQNRFEVVVEREYDADADCFVWKLVEVLINGKKRAGPLKSLIAGVDVGIRICIFAGQDGGSLEFLGVPKIV